MNCIELANKNGFTVLNEGCGLTREVTGVYCCDLLSIVMGRAKENDAWITVMGNINSIAVAVLSDVSCIILSEGMGLDFEAMNKAIGQQICVLKANMPTFEAATLVNESLKMQP